MFYKSVLNEAELCSILKEAKTIAVVGLSREENRTSRQIADFLVSKGFKVAGVHPAAHFIEGIKVYKSLKEIPFKIDIVDVFRRNEFIPDLVDDVIEVSPKCMWLQLGVRNDKAAADVRKHNISVVQDTCIAIQYNQCSEN